MRKIILVVTIVLSLICYTENTHGQVTIGLAEKPVSGALLELKNIGGITDGGSNANKGLGLPKVALVSETDLYPMFNNNKEYYEANKREIDREHIGLLVYNTKDLRIITVIPETDCNPLKITQDGNLDIGLALWNGEIWENIIQPEVDVKEDKDKEANEIFPNVFLLNDHEGNTYTYSKFRDAGYWMTTSLITKSFPPSGNSSLVYFLWDSSKSEEENTSLAFYGYPRKVLAKSINSDVDFQDNHHVGLLYSRGAITGGNQIADGMQGICPQGWHIPHSTEYEELLTEIKTNWRDYTYATELGELTRSLLITTNCSEFGPVLFPPNYTVPVSKPAFKGGFAFIMSAWADCQTGTVSNNEVFELVCTNSNVLGFVAGQFSDNFTGVWKEVAYQKHNWTDKQMITIRCKKDN